jgi:hypothetical protein
MECKRDDMTEVIADAIAEEEVAKEQLRKKMQEATEQAKKNFKERLGTVKPMVTITMDEYIALKDAERVLEIVWKGARLYSYDKNNLRVDCDSDLSVVLKLLYPERYEEVVKRLQAEDEKKENE